MFDDDEIAARIDEYGETEDEARASLMAETFGGDVDEYEFASRMADLDEDEGRNEFVSFGDVDQDIWIDSL